MPRGYLTPDSIPASLTRRWICFPDDQYILAAINGALWELTFPFNWELFGAITPDEITEALIPYILDFQASEAVCMPLQGAPVFFEDQKTQNTAGGASTSGSWQTRTLNQILNPASYDVSLSSNQFTLPAGLWMIEWSAPAFQAAAHQTRLWSVTEAAQISAGSSEQCIQTDSVQTRSVGQAIQNNVAPTTYRIEHRVTQSKATNGYGVPTNQTQEKYTLVKCTPLA
jgi:hypothetical protein